MFDELVSLATKIFDFLEKIIDVFKWVISNFLIPIFYYLEEVVEWIIRQLDDLIPLIVIILPILKILLGVIIILNASLIGRRNKDLRVFSLAVAGIGGCYCYLDWFNKLDTLSTLEIFDILGCLLGAVFGVIAASIITNISNSKES